MAPQATTRIVLRHLVKEWERRLPVLSMHLEAELGYVATRPLGIKRLIICRQADGDVAAGNIGGRFAAKWVLKGSRLKAVPIDYAWRRMYDADDSGVIYVSPSFLFCCEGNRIRLSERYADCLKHRLLGELVDARSEPTIEWQTLWKTRW